VFADTHVNIGIGAGAGGQVIWPFLIGVNRAKYFLMTGDRMKRREAVEIGLANFNVDDTAQLMPKALEVAEQLATGAPQAIAASKGAVNAYLRAVSSTIMPMRLTAERVTKQTDDQRKAVRAFQEKRPAQFTGK
jgi:enoyl-CoA hydratase